PNDNVVHLLAEVGVLILLFEIGLEMQLRDLLKVGGAAAAVALTGVVLPFAAGYGIGIALGESALLSLFLGATLTATSVGVTARVLRDLGQLASPESRIILGAAVIDDVLGLILLSLITGVLAGGTLTPGGSVRIAAVAVAFLAGALVVGRLLVPHGLRLVSSLRVQGALVPAAMTLAFGLAFLAAESGSAMIIGAFAAGLILAETDRRHQLEEDVRPVAHLFVPIFFVAVGAQVDLRPFNPLVRESWPLIGGVVGISLVAIVTKWAAGLAPFWLRVRKNAIGLGMVPRGEVGLIFAQVGRTSGLLNDEQFSAIVLVVMITTFAAPVLLRRALPRYREERVTMPVPGPSGAVEGLVSGEPPRSPVRRLRPPGEE
ncbi:MAG: cation:proton antiporter, partial [Gemmatimonadota bacterium]